MPPYTTNPVREEEELSFLGKALRDLTFDPRAIQLFGRPGETFLEESSGEPSIATTATRSGLQVEIEERFEPKGIQTLTEEHPPFTSLERIAFATEVVPLPSRKAQIEFKDLVDKQLVTDLVPESLLSKLNEMLDYLKEYEPLLFQTLIHSSQAVNLDDLYSTLEFIGAVETPPDFDFEKFLREWEDLTYGGE